MLKNISLQDESRIIIRMHYTIIYLTQILNIFLFLCSLNEGTQYQQCKTVFHIFLLSKLLFFVPFLSQERKFAIICKHCP